MRSEPVNAGDTGEPHFGSTALLANPREVRQRREMIHLCFSKASTQSKGSYLHESNMTGASRKAELRGSAWHLLPCCVIPVHIPPPRHFRRCSLHLVRRRGGLLRSPCTNCDRRRLHCAGVDLVGGMCVLQVDHRGNILLPFCGRNGVCDTEIGTCPATLPCRAGLATPFKPLTQCLVLIRVLWNVNAAEGGDEGTGRRQCNGSVGRCAWDARMQRPTCEELRAGCLASMPLDSNKELMGWEAFSLDHYVLRDGPH